MAQIVCSRRSVGIEVMMGWRTPSCERLTAVDRLGGGSSRISAGSLQTERLLVGGLAWPVAPPRLVGPGGTPTLPAVTPRPSSSRLVSVIGAEGQGNGGGRGHR
jgi:hypothetical protein